MFDFLHQEVQGLVGLVKCSGSVLSKYSYLCFQQSRTSLWTANNQGLKLSGCPLDKELSGCKGLPIWVVEFLVLVAHWLDGMAIPMYNSLSTGQRLSASHKAHRRHWGQKWWGPTLVPFCPFTVYDPRGLGLCSDIGSQVTNLSLVSVCHSQNRGMTWVSSTSFIHRTPDPSYLHDPSTPWCGFFAPSCRRGRVARLCSSLPVEGSILATNSCSLHWLHKYTMEIPSRCWPETPATLEILTTLA